MHVNDLIEFLASQHGILECKKVDGANRITMTLVLEDTELQAVGGDIESVFASADKQYKRYVKNRGVIRIGGRRAKK